MILLLVVATPIALSSLAFFYASLQPRRDARRWRKRASSSDRWPGLPETDDKPPEEADAPRPRHRPRHIDE
ncbi:hypothetical protein [Aureimonas glaciei]|jgi:hypothetical protein|uniref:Uncharacterized protein n=1 Tax=Aureimonas glaciei TaxID=1776957 RepID=A0A916XYW3_9HYPH|nr:hypothetical protein [Aureimonas glaciei]GGD21834.1 hypothetical protein GCM10011335_25980 [Aureimonas glaciei]